MAAPVLTSTDSASSSTLLGIGNGGDFSRFVSIASTDAVVVADTVTCFRFLFTETGTATALLGAAFNYKLVG